MSSVNRVTLIGHLGKDPETRYTQNGDAVCTFSIATSENWKNKNGERVERTEWHNIVFYQKLAEIAQQYLSKGKQVYIEGRIQSRKYQDKTGIERTFYEIVGNSMTMLGSRDQAVPFEGSSGGNITHKTSVSSSSPEKTTAEAVSSPEIVDDMDDDIPF